MYSTVWKSYDFSMSQILRKINIHDFGSAKSAILIHVESLNIFFLRIFALFVG